MTHFPVGFREGFLATLTHDESLAWQAVELEDRKHTLAVRMPEGDTFDSLWLKLQVAWEASGQHRQLRRYGLWASAEELDEVVGDIHWLWPLYIPIGFLTLMVGDPGVGKSMTILDFCNRIIEGLPFPGMPIDAELNYTNSKVVWVETENGQQILNVRLRSMGMRRSHIIMPSFGGELLGQPDLGEEVHRNRLINAIRYTRPGLVVIDSLGNAHKGGENRVEEVRPVLGFLAALSRDENVPIVMTHHLNKGKMGENPNVSLGRVRGSGYITAMSRSVLYLERGVDDRLRLSSIKSNLGKMPPALQVSYQLDEHDNPLGVNYEPWDEPEEKQTKKQRCAKWLYDFLAPHPEGCLVVDILTEADKLGFNKVMVYECRALIGHTLWETKEGKFARWSVKRNPLQLAMETLEGGGSDNPDAGHPEDFLDGEGDDD